MKKIFLFHFLLLTTISIHSQNFQGWNKKQPIVINSSLVEGVSPLVDFPVLITLDHINDEVIDGGSYSALDGGGDIRFSSDAAGDNQLATEIVVFVTSSTPANRKCQIWVKIPSLSPTTDTTIYLWYNKEGETQPLATDPYGSQAVWTNYEAVWHMENDPNTATPQILDATGNGYNLSSFGAMPASAVVNGAIGNGVVFDGVDDYFALANDLSLSSSYTFSAWYNWDSTSTQEHSIILSIGPTTYHSFSLYENLSLDYYGGAGATTNIFTSANTIAQDVMQKWDFVATNGAGQHYLNSNTLTANRTTGVVAGDIKYMGGDLESYIKGWLDEIRISSDSKSEDWIKTEYTNQTNASGFATAGIPQVALTDTQVPTAPTLSSTAQTDTTIDLSWTAATDNIAVTGYNVYKDGVLEITLGNVLSYQVTGLTASTAYDFTVTALDAAGNESAISNALAITTDAASGGGTGSYWSLNNQDVYYNTGNVGIGTNIPDSKLTVKGSIHSEEVKVDLSVPAPDYVFKSDYNLTPLEKLQEYIKAHGHLPNMPSAKDMETHGIELGIMNMKLLEKIEELTLYILQQEKRIKKLEANLKIKKN